MNILFISNREIPDVTETVEENLNSRFLLKAKRFDVANSSWSLFSYIHVPCHAARQQGMIGTTRHYGNREEILMMEAD